MQPREKKLAMAVGALIAVLMVFFGGKKLRTAYEERETALRGVQNELAEQEAQLASGARAQRAYRELEARSLSSDAEKARSQYQNWLLSGLEKAKFANVEVRNISGGAARRVFQPLSFSITARATAPQAVDWLHHFYSTGHLHTIRRMTVTPIEKSKQLELDIGIETIVLPRAKGVSEPPARTDRLALGTVEEYRRVISGRYLFGLRNHPPALAPSTRVAAKVGQPVAFTASARDPDPLDKVSFKLGSDAPAGAEIDAATGKFTWKPPADRGPGEVKFQITATDDGLPAATATQTVTVALERVSLKLASLGDQKVEAGKALSLSPRLSEHDSSLTKTWSLAGEVPEGMKFDAKSGRIDWTPTEEDIGESVPLTLAVTDSATPPNRDEKKFAIAVVEPKVAPISLDFNARHTYLTGIVEVNGLPEAWFFVRPTGESIKISMTSTTDAPQLKAGNFTARVAQIDKDAVTLQNGTRRWTVHLGKSLGDAIAESSAARP